MSIVSGELIDRSDMDPAAEFLAREQNQLAGLEDDFEESSILKKNLVNVVADKNDGFEIIESNNKIISDNHLNSNGFIDTAIDKINGTLSKLQTADIKSEPDKIRKWRDDQKYRLEKKDEEEKRIQREWNESAKKELHEWYQKHDEAINKIKAANRNAEKQHIEDMDRLNTAGSEWEKVAKLCDFSAKTTKSNKDVTRMRSIILQLKQATNKIPKAKILQP